MGDTAVVTGEAVETFLELVYRDYRAFQNRVLGADWSDHLDVGLAEGGRTSLIVDPPNGRLPPLTELAIERQAEGRARHRAAHGPEDRMLQERCLVYKSAPIGWSGDSNNVLILQTPDTVVILHEMIHEALIIQLDGRPHLPSHIRQWSGDARGRWEGDTLVVETVNRHAQWRSGIDPFMDTLNMRVVERFTRVDADTLSYEFTVDDPETYTRSWSAAWPMRRTEQPLYEYACHEGNYSMPMTLAGARVQEATAEAESKQ